MTQVGHAHVDRASRHLPVKTSLAFITAGLVQIKSRQACHAKRLGAMDNALNHLEGPSEAVRRPPWQEQLAIERCIGLPPAAIYFLEPHLRALS
jgi:hypothetical protein